MAEGAGVRDGTAMPADPPSVWSPNRLSAVFWTTVITGGAALVAAGYGLVSGRAVVEPVALVVLGALVVFGELRPVVTTRSYGDGVTPSIAFTFAIMFLWGPWPALLIQALASVVADVAMRKQWWRVVFNPAQYALSFLAAWVCLYAVGYRVAPFDMGHVTAADLLPMGLSWVVYFVVNDALVSAVLAAYSRESFRGLFLEDFGYLVASNVSVFVISPLVAVAVGISVWWVVLLLPPLAAVYRTSAVSLEKEYQAGHDSLTGLPNRTLLLAQLEQAIDSRRDGAVALALIDLDRFKEVNDTLGHLTGDRLLVLVAERIRAAVRPADVVARLGGDEFAIVLPAVPDAEAAKEVAERIRAAVAEPFGFEGLLLELEASVGIALFPDHGADVHQLQRSADVAMYLAKEEGSGVEVYDPEQDRHSTSRLGLLGSLRQAIDGGQLELHYQPKLALRTGEVTGLEALVRWRHPHRGLVFPDEFVPLAECSGLMTRLTEFVLDEALAQAARWRALGLEMPVAVNVSARDLHGPALARTIARGLERHDLPASALLLELTERVLMAESSRLGDTLAELERLGVRLSLDDFGTGYSSMVLLKRLPVSEIKIERLFVQRIGQSEEDASIVRSIVGLARALGIQTVAEGVETEAAWERLAALGCDSAQGWFVSRPMPAERATQWLLRHEGRPHPLRVVRAVGSGTA